MDKLRDANVFFVPEDDVYYYEALGDKVAGRTRSAIDNYRRFVAALPASPWVGRATRHIEELRAVLDSERTTTKPARGRGKQPTR